MPDSSDLEELAIRVIRESAVLGSRVHPITRRSVVELLRTINSYYSNLIEGHATHPIDIERAMMGDYSTDPARRALQLEGKAHVEVDVLIEQRLEEDPLARICAPEFLCWIHREFYERMPGEHRVILDPATGESLPVIAGELRHRDVTAGGHRAPSHEAVPPLLERFSEIYDPVRLSEIGRVVAFAASHHRLLWIHPFLDGNGRVARLFSHAYARRAKIDGHGLWTISRGLARRREDYMAALSRADQSRENDYDGRGSLSLRALNDFCRFFLETCIDQIQFMSEMLELDGLAERISGYVSLRSHGMIPGRDELRSEAAYLLIEAMHRGEVARGEAERIAGLGARTARYLVSKLTDEQLLYSETPKASIRLGLPMHVVGYYFPRLYSDEAGLVTTQTSGTG